MRGDDADASAEGNTQQERIPETVLYVSRDNGVLVSRVTKKNLTRTQHHRRWQPQLDTAQTMHAHTMSSATMASKKAVHCGAARLMPCELGSHLIIRTPDAATRRSSTIASNR
jgi:hypothetical protein